MTHMKQSENGAIPPSVSFETRRCPCGKEDCRPGQRNGYACHKAAQDTYRARRAAEQQRKDKELNDLRLKVMAAEARAGEHHG